MRRVPFRHPASPACRVRAGGAAAGAAGRLCRVGMVAERCRAQLLSGRPVGSPEDVAQRLLAGQAQDPRGARLAVRARTVGLLATDVDRALTQDRSLVVDWLTAAPCIWSASRTYPA